MFAPLDSRAVEALRGRSEKGGVSYTREVRFTWLADLYDCAGSGVRITEYSQFVLIFLPFEQPDLFLNWEKGGPCKYLARGKGVLRISESRRSLTFDLLHLLFHARKDHERCTEHFILAIIGC